MTIFNVIEKQQKLRFLLSVSFIEIVIANPNHCCKPKSQHSQQNSVVVAKNEHSCNQKWQICLLDIG